MGRAKTRRNQLTSLYTIEYGFFKALVGLLTKVISHKKSAPTKNQTSFVPAVEALIVTIYILFYYSAPVETGSDWLEEMKMKTAMKIIIAALMVMVLTAPGVKAGDKPWFDMEKCGMCKILMKYDGLMEHMTWEHHNISNGVVSVTTVAPEYLPAFRKASQQMNEASMKLQKGEKMELCEMCTAMGSICVKAPTMDFVETSTGDVWVITSDKPEVVADLHKWTDRTNKEMAMMMASENKGHPHK